MNQEKNLLILNGEEKTAEVRICSYDSVRKKYKVVFQTNPEKAYYYNPSSIEWSTNPMSVDPAMVQIWHNGKLLFNIQRIAAFRVSYGEYWHITFQNGTGCTYAVCDLKIVRSCLSDSVSLDCLSYLRQLAAINELKSDDGEVILKKQYEKLTFIDCGSVLALYLNPKNTQARTYAKQPLIFPFGGNASQFRAVECALENQLSVIQGPPGTGKTQTILNIIANLLVQGKSIQVVSCNNSAVENVQEKLSGPKYGMGFLVAALGNSENKKQFIASQTGQISNISGWKRDPAQQKDLQTDIKKLTEELSDTFTKQERLAQAKLELDALRLEMKYFEQYCVENKLERTEVRLHRGLSAKKLMQLWQECSVFSEQERSVSFWFKIKSALMYGLSDWTFYKNDMDTIVTLFQRLFYQAQESELSEEIKSIEEQLILVDAKEKMNRLTNCSLDFLRAKLFERYGSDCKRTCFTAEDLWKNSETIVGEYPVILSTTFSSRSCLRGVTYDYVIMDEASQVDISTGALALASARNAVIVGDLKQLPNVVKGETKQRSDEVFRSFSLPEGYSFSENSFLKSICTVFPDVPQTLLREHYRCHPKIIGFCNQKFYHNELIIMTEDHGEKDVLSAFRTVTGNHRRGRINQRQIDVLEKEVLPMLQNVSHEEIGVIAPYRDQVKELSTRLEDTVIQVDTVHKYQGREKDAVIMTTVDDVVTRFSDDPYLLNVAISRAKKQFYIIASGEEQPMDSNIGDLLDYIAYNNFSVIQSKIYSVFDLLYRQYTDVRMAYLKKHRRISKYDSENLMYAAIVDILEKYPDWNLRVICHQRLDMLIRDYSLLSIEEQRYVKQVGTHLDFLIYHTISKKPVLAIEVDGFNFHRPGTDQFQRDRMKDHIMEQYQIPMLRCPTNGSGELERIERVLCGYAAE